MATRFGMVDSVANVMQFFERYCVHFNLLSVGSREWARSFRSARYERETNGKSCEFFLAIYTRFLVEFFILLLRWYFFPKESSLLSKVRALYYIPIYIYFDHWPNVENLRIVFLRKLPKQFFQFFPSIKKNLDRGGESHVREEG